MWFPLKGVQDRASIKLFTKECLLPGAGKFPEPSQKIISATASRYFIFWASSMIQDFMNKLGDQATEYMKYHALLYSKSVFLFTPKPGIIKNLQKKQNTIWSFVKNVPLRYQAALLGSLATIELLTLEHGRVMSAEACTEFRRSYLVYRGALNWLANENLKKRKCRFHLRPKVHQLSHICWDFLPLNPRRYSNYLDEDFIFKTKKVAERVHPLHMPMHVCMRYSIAVCLRWSDGALWKWCEKDVV